MLMRSIKEMAKYNQTRIDKDLLANESIFITHKILLCTRRVHQRHFPSIEQNTNIVRSLAS